MCLFCSLIPATIFVTIGFFVLFAASKAEGGVKKCGKVLATWIFIVATFFPVMGAYVTVSDICPIEKVMESMQSAETPLIKAG